MVNFYIGEKIIENYELAIAIYRYFKINNPLKKLKT